MSVTIAWQTVIAEGKTNAVNQISVPDGAVANVIMILTVVCQSIVVNVDISAMIMFADEAALGKHAVPLRIVVVRQSFATPITNVSSVPQTVIVVGTNVVSITNASPPAARNVHRILDAPVRSIVVSEEATTLTFVEKTVLERHAPMTVIVEGLRRDVIPVSTNVSTLLPVLQTVIVVGTNVVSITNASPPAARNVHRILDAPVRSIVVSEEATTVTFVKKAVLVRHAPMTVIVEGLGKDVIPANVRNLLKPHPGLSQ